MKKKPINKQKTPKPTYYMPGDCYLALQTI